jgi:hypothetical protein
MNMRTVVIYISAAVIVVILGALMGVYFFLRGQTQAAQNADQGRGLSSEAPFGSPAGSTYENIVSDFSQKGGSSASTTPRNFPQLWQVDKTPVAGFSFGIASSSKPILSFVEVGTGYVFSGDVSTENVNRLTNTLIPKIGEALLGSSGVVIERAQDQSSGGITTFAGKIAHATSSAATTTLALVGSYLDPNIFSIVINQATNEIFYIESGLPRAVGIRAQWDGSKKKTVFSSGIQHWRLNWLPDGRILALTPPADGIAGYAYTIGNDGSMTSLIAGIPGLTILPKAGASALLYAQSTGSRLTLFAQAKSDSSVSTLPLQTVADKCVWAPGSALIVYCAVPRVSPTGNFLNDWYKGLMHTSDSWWRIDVSSNQAQLIFAPDASLSLDVMNPLIDTTGHYIAFKNAADDSLWTLRINK